MYRHAPFDPFSIMACLMVAIKQGKGVSFFKAGIGVAGRGIEKGVLSSQNRSPCGLTTGQVE